MKFKVIVIWVLILSLFTQSSLAEPSAEDALKILVKEYVTQKVKEEVKNFLNSNPEVLFSPGAEQIGTEALKYVGLAMHAYNFLTAETDKQKLFAAAGAASAVYAIPYAGWILFAVQMVDLAATLEHQKELAKIYEETKRIQLRTIRILEQVYTLEFTEQIRVIQAIQKSHEEIFNLVQAIKEDPVIQTLSGEKMGEVTSDQVEEAFAKVSKLQKAFTRYDVHIIFFNHIVELKAVGSVDIRESIATFNESVADVKSALSGIHESVYQIFISAKADSTWAIIDDKVMKKNTQLSRYVRCAEIVNEYASIVLKADEVVGVRFELEELKDVCVEQYNWKVANEVL